MPEPTLLEDIALRKVSTDVYTNAHPLYDPGTSRVYGGQVLAHAILAAYSTVEEKALSIHSIHSYFMLAGI